MIRMACVSRLAAEKCSLQSVSASRGRPLIVARACATRGTQHAGSHLVGTLTAAVAAKRDGCRHTCVLALLLLHER
jgi:hypothetical protein